MRLSPVDVEVLDLTEGAASVRLWGEAHARHAALGAGELSISIEDGEHMVVAVAWMAS
jgi:phosphopantetheinyl transferase (holo-ACP synthase)